MKLHVTGMTCQHCVRSITSAITTIDPGAGVVVDLEALTVTISGNVPQEAAEAAITELGYRVAPVSTSKSCCGSCH